ncbi:putative Nucleoporin GLE1 [Hibiscus syriacus]|uniref:Nucleoporin GLE1 n=1 Tax=Hibiscus syriacus TaxID=106335 RepID=A0A6A2ZLG8_HIBSY|nr:glycosyl hydrolase 5 family protein-like [Hibiscus syriacus]KAE8692593.1 putative Nucleoporin GLE1 [Hibiscus syriacus]
MAKFTCFFFLHSLLILIIIQHVKTSESLPLSTTSRWIVDEKGRRVKLACVNWVSHLEPMVAEGLSKRPMDDIAKQTVSMGFNCVRLTWPLFFITDDSLGSLTVRRSFQRLGLLEPIAGIQANNPSVIDATLIEAFQAVVSSLGKNNVMVILDNHISKPGWCCGYSDGDGFFGDWNFNPNLWILGLTRMATLFNGVANVVAMSLRNELRGPKQNTNDWYRYMQKGAEAVHAANPNVLVVLSGLNYDRDLSFIRTRPPALSFGQKLVFELHWYGFSDGDAWVTNNPNSMCGKVIDYMMKTSGFLVDAGYPLLVSEFGIDIRGNNVNDNRYLDCFLGVVAELDLDWALWTLVGSYYLRDGTVGFNEYYGIMDWNWIDIRNSSFNKRLSALQSPFRGPGLTEMELHKVIFHPSTGLCILRKPSINLLGLGPCTDSEPWNYSPQKTLELKGANLCLQADAFGTMAELGITCGGSNSKWEMISDSMMHLSLKLENGTLVCLDVDSNGNIIMNGCKCLNRDSRCDPESQWFKLVDSTRSGNLGKSFVDFDSTIDLGIPMEPLFECKTSL